MSKRVIFTHKAPAPIGPYSQAIKAGNFIFGSGQISINPKNNKLEGKNIEEQTKIIMENIKNILEENGYTLNDVVHVFVFLRNLEDYKKFNEIYGQFFTKDPPARTTIEVSDLPKGALIEISFIAYKE
ncbi:MAG: RidA family protein [Thermoproteales archaeon]|nr:RidA family protein [Thermoproteales archaeon]